MSASVSGLARFYADPRKVRVSIRRWLPAVADEDVWRAQATAGELSAVSFSTIPAIAVREALEMAEAVGIDGIDLGLCGTYHHPWASLTRRIETCMCPATSEYDPPCPAHGVRPIGMRGDGSWAVTEEDRHG